MDESGDNKIYHVSNSLFGNHKKPQVTLSAVGPVRLQKIKIGKNCSNNDNESEKKSPCSGATVWSVSKEKTAESLRSLHNSHTYSKKGIKHALRQQAKRRRKNTTIAAGNSAPLPRFVTPTSVDTAEDEDNRLKQPTTMNDILTSIPGFCIKHRKRTNKKLSTAAQLEQTKEGCIDLETPDSILVQTNLRDLLNEHAFLSLPPLYQYKLVQLLPPIDRISIGSPSDCVYKLSPSGLNNEFFKSACSEWKDRLAEGEFTPENQQKRKLEAERERNKLDPWKVKHFEPIWGENINVANTGVTLSDKDSISPKSVGNKSQAKRPPSPTLRSRTVGAVTRSVSMYREKREAEDSGCDTNKKFKPASNPSTNYLTQFNMEGKGSIIYEKKRLDKPLEIKIVESRNEHRDRQEIPLIKAVQFEPDLSMCSILGTKALTNEDGGIRDSTDSSATNEDTTSMNVNSEAVECAPSAASNTSNSTIPNTSSVLLPTFINVDFRAAAPESEPAANTDAESKEYESIDTVEEIIIMEKEEQEDDEDEEETNENVECETVEPCDKKEEEKEELTSDNIDKEAATEKTCTVEEIPSEKSAYSEEVPEVETVEEPESESTCIENVLNVEKELATASEKIDEDDRDTTLLEDSVNIEKIINEEAENWVNSKEDQVHAAILAAAWDAVDSSTETLLAEVSLTETVFGEGDEDQNVTNDMKKGVDEPLEDVSNDAENLIDANENEIENPKENIELEQVASCLPEAEDNTIEIVLPASDCVNKQAESAEEPTEKESKSSAAKQSENKSTILEEPISIDRIIDDGDENWDNSKEEQVQAAILAAAWNAVDSSTEKLLAEAVLERDTEVAVIPMQEELEVKLEESSSPAPEWAASFANKGDDAGTTDSKRKSSSKVAYSGGHVKLELEVTLTPEVDSQVSSTGDSSGSASKANSTTSAVITPSTVIPPTTIVCLPTTNTSVPPPPTTQIVTNQAVSSSALPYIALTTSTPVRAVPTKTQAKSGGRGGRNSCNKPPPGAVNLERSYQICQAVIQNSPNRDQLKFQLKPPPSLLSTDKDYVKPQTSNRGGIPKSAKNFNVQPSQNQVLVKHVFTSAQGIPVTMAVLPPSNTELTESQMGQYVLVQRSGLGSGIRRSNSAPPSNQKSGTYGIGGRGRPASVGMQQHQQNAACQPQPVMRTIVTNPNGSTYYSIPQQYNLVTRVNNDCSGCSRKAMVMCKKCGAFCHDDCIEPYKMCVNCR